MYSKRLPPCTPPCREEMRRWRHAHPTTHVTSPMVTAQLRGSKHQRGTMPATRGGPARLGAAMASREGRHLSSSMLGGCGAPVDESMARQRGSQPAASGISSTVGPLSAISCNKLRGHKQPSESRGAAVRRCGGAAVRRCGGAAARRRGGAGRARMRVGRVAAGRSVQATGGGPAGGARPSVGPRAARACARAPLRRSGSGSRPAWGEAHGLGRG